MASVSKDYEVSSESGGVGARVGCFGSYSCVSGFKYGLYGEEGGKAESVKNLVSGPGVRFVDVDVGEIDGDF